MKWCLNVKLKIKLDKTVENCLLLFMLFNPYALCHFPKNKS